MSSNKEEYLRIQRGKCLFELSVHYSDPNDYQAHWALFKRFGYFKKELMTSINEQHFSKSEISDPQIASKDWRDPLHKTPIFKKKLREVDIKDKNERFITYDSDPHFYEFAAAPSRSAVLAEIEQDKAIEALDSGRGSPGMAEAVIRRRAA